MEAKLSLDPPGFTAHLRFQARGQRAVGQLQLLPQLIQRIAG